MDDDEEGESMTPLPAEEEGDKDLVARCLEQRSWRIKELIETENDYVKDLAQVVQLVHLFLQNALNERQEKRF